MEPASRSIRRAISSVSYSLKAAGALRLELSTAMATSAVLRAGRVPEPISDPVNATTRFCAVYGHPIKHSASPALQNAALAVLGLNWRYLAFEVHPDDLRVALEGAKAMRFIGINLTVPHKLLAMKMVDLLDESARTWGAVNTIRFEGLDDDGQWLPLRNFSDTSRQIRSHGFNTDADAISHALREDLGLELSKASALLLGAGGAGRTGGAAIVKGCGRLIKGLMSALSRCVARR